VPPVPTPIAGYPNTAIAIRIVSDIRPRCAIITARCIITPTVAIATVITITTASITSGFRVSRKSKKKAYY